jgi:hypothetical protein
VTQQAPQQAAWTQPTTPTGAAGPYHSRPDLHPPLINTTVGSGVAPGLLFAGDASIGGSGAQSGAIIYDNSGQPVWFNPTTTGLLTDLRPVTYRGQSALAYFQPTTTPYPPDTNGVEIVLDNAYRQIGTIQAGNGYSINQHDVKISPDGKSALFNVWNPVPFDLSKYCSGSPPSCGPKNGIVLEAVVQLRSGHLRVAQLQPT